MEISNERKNKTHFKSTDARLILAGIGLSVLFWIFESAAHVFVFRDTGFIYQIYHPELHEIWMRLTVVSMFVAFGIYAQMIVAARRRAEEAAMLANAELSQIFDTSADGMRVIDKEFTVLRANDTFSKLSGLSKEEIVGKKCYEVFSGPLCNTNGCPLTRILSNGDRIECDSEKVRKDGVKVPCIVTASPFRESDGEIIGIVEDFKDISDRKKFEEEVLQSRERLRDLAAHLQVVREEERRRIAREIHDELGQALTALKMDIYWLSHQLPKEKQLLLDKAKAMSTLIDRTVKSVKRISSDLRPGLLDDLGLSAAIEWQAEEFTNRTGIQCEIFADPEDIVLDEQRSIAIFRIFQETLTNVARHANATNVLATLKKEDGRVAMRVCDNGKGIDKKHISDPKSYGLIGMYERVHSLGGNLIINGIRRKGTTIEVSIPING